MDITPPVYKKKSNRIAAICLMVAYLFLALRPVTAHASVAPVNAPDIQVEQIFTKTSDYAESETFTYRLAGQNAANPLPNGSAGGQYTFTLTDNITQTLPTITFSDRGVYAYQMEQVVSISKTGITYDTQVYTATAYVDYINSRTELQADWVILNSQGQKVEKVVFENIYAPLSTNPSLMVDPPVSKSVTGNPTSSGTFTFTLTAQNSSNPMPDGSENGEKTLIIVGSGTGKFGTWAYTKADVYYYMVSEVNTNGKGYQYDTMVYTITDVVTDVDGQLELNRTITNSSGSAVTSLDFVNHYTGESTSTLMSTGSKTGDESMFELYWIVFFIGAAVFLTCAIYLVAGKRRKRKSSDAE